MWGAEGWGVRAGTLGTKGQGDGDTVERHPEVFGACADDSQEPIGGHFLPEVKPDREASEGGMFHPARQSSQVCFQVSISESTWPLSLPPSDV